jgi:hypothetical protein
VDHDSDLDGLALKMLWFSVTGLQVLDCHLDFDAVRQRWSKVPYDPPVAVVLNSVSENTIWH